MNNKISFEDTTTAFQYKSDRELKRSFLLFSSINNRLLVKLGTNMVKLALKIKVPIKGILRKTLFHQFCGGESIDDCTRTIKVLSKYQVGTILDYAVEGEDKEEDFEHTAEEIKRTILMARENSDIPFSVFKPSGIASVEILRKTHEGEPLNETEKRALANIKRRFHLLGETAAANHVRLFIDSEESWIQKPIDDFTLALMQKYNSKTAIIFNTFQMYRKGMLDRLINLVESTKGNFIVGAKLVRGAYMEKERERAEEKGYPDPILPNKQATDEQYNKALEYCIKNIDHIHICSGSHNENSNILLTRLMKEANIKNDDERVYFAQLYGMSDNISFNLAKNEYKVAKYLPYGPIESVLPYLFRRAEENTAIAGQSSRELELIKKERKRRNI